MTAFRQTILCLAGAMLLGGSLDTAAQLGRQRDRQAPADRENPALASVVASYSEHVDWTPVAAVVVETNDPKHPWIDGYRAPLAEMIAAALADAGLNAQLPSDTAFTIAGNEQDEQMRADGTLLSLARFMEADCLVMVSVNRFSERELEAMGQTRRDCTLQMSVRVLDAARGATRGAESIRVERSARARDDRAFVFEDMLDEAVAGVTAQLAGAMAETIAALEEVEAAPSPTIMAYADAVGMTMPDIRKIGGEWQAADSEVSVCPRFTLKVGGVALGTGPGVFDLSPITPGLHMVEIASEGFEPYRTKMFIKDGMTLNVSLRMTPAFRAEWKDRVAFFAELRQSEKLTEAQIEVMEGYADWLRDSQYSIDIKYDHRANIEANLQHQLDSGEVGDADTFDEVTHQRLEALGPLPDVNIDNSVGKNVQINDFSQRDRAQFESFYMGRLGF